MKQELSFYEKIGYPSAVFDLILLENEKIIDFRSIRNLVLISGRKLLADLLFGLNSTPFLNVAVGSGTAKPEETDVALENEIARKPFSNILRDGLVVTCNALFETDEANGTLSEIGCVSSISSAGIFYNRAVFLPLTKTSMQTLLIVVRFFA
ncbi:MAG: hypothetical protein NC820_07570 [Candidatus Omnitrophica bacterium]|nr:hypothetical protein [Candidatus Omnitrophota bacterium]